MSGRVYRSERQEDWTRLTAFHKCDMLGARAKWAPVLLRGDPNQGPSLVAVDPEMMQIRHAPLGIWRIEPLALIVAHDRKSAGTDLKPAHQFRLRSTTTPAVEADNVVLEHGTADQCHRPGIVHLAFGQWTNPEKAQTSGLPWVTNFDELDLLIGKPHGRSLRNQDLVADVCQPEIYGLESRRVGRRLCPQFHALGRQQLKKGHDEGDPAQQALCPHSDQGCTAVLRFRKKNSASDPCRVLTGLLTKAPCWRSLHVQHGPRPSAKNAAGAILSASMSNPRRLGEWSRRTVCPSCIDGATGRISV